MNNIHTAYQHIKLTPEQLSELCQRWKITELAVFGSAANGNFTPESDLDILVKFETSATWNLWDLSGLRLELEQHAGRHVDLLELDKIKNPFVRYEALTTRQVLYAA